MGRLETPGDLDPDPEHPIEGQGAAGEEACEGAAGDVLQDDVVAISLDADVVPGGDVRVVEL